MIDNQQPEAISNKEQQERSQNAATTTERHVTAFALGTACVDTLGYVREFPRPDTKIRTTSTFRSVGGNGLVAAITLSRLGVKTSYMCKVAKDQVGREILECLRQNEVETAAVVVASEEGSATSFTYVIVDTSSNTRTCIHTPGVTLSPSDLCFEHAVGPCWLQEEAFFRISKPSVFLSDGRHPEVNESVTLGAHAAGIPIVLDDEGRATAKMLSVATVVVTNETAILAKLKKKDALACMWSMFKMAPGWNDEGSSRMVVLTLGKDGALLMYNDSFDPSKHHPQEPEPYIESFADFAKWLRRYRIEHSNESTQQRREAYHTCLERTISRFGAKKGMTLLHCPAYPLLPDELVDTTGAGDVFVGGVAYGLAHSFPAPQLLALACYMASTKCCQKGLLGIPFSAQVPPQLLKQN